jgi:hypothetical protein
MVTSRKNRLPLLLLSFCLFTASVNGSEEKLKLKRFTVIVYHSTVPPPIEEYDMVMEPSGLLAGFTDGKEHTDTILKRNLQQLMKESKDGILRVHLYFESEEKTTLARLKTALARIEKAAPDCQTMLYLHLWEQHKGEKGVKNPR